MLFLTTLVGFIWFDHYSRNNCTPDREAMVLHRVIVMQDVIDNTTVTRPAVGYVARWPGL